MNAIPANRPTRYKLRIGGPPGEFAVSGTFCDPNAMARIPRQPIGRLLLRLAVLAEPGSTARRSRLRSKLDRFFRHSADTERVGNHPENSWRTSD